MQLRFTPRALRELDAILAHIAARAPAGAHRVRVRLQATFDILLINPALGRRTSHPRLRRIAATPFPYLVFYEILPDEVVIIAVRHGARDPASMPAL